MKRDLDLCKSLLEELEKGSPILCFPDRPEAEVLDHFAMLCEAGLLKGQVIRGSSGQILAASFERLSWDGHNFLAAARNASTWEQAKNRILATGGTWTLDLLKSLLLEIGKQALRG
jgi:hypothetical protein